MDTEFSKVLSPSGIRWGFINVGMKQRHLFPSGYFTIIYNGERFKVCINNANRIVCKRLLREMEAHIGNTLTLKKEPNGDYSIILSLLSDYSQAPTVNRENKDPSS